ncbi:hypothetical protein PGTUg99_010234 [Puccinia graminis f. sp. tritici]|uniref:Uncharacterized protein n=1 Tax=Puccinia graminis f. sp. tritici TaxID=56615 RepID=A0A5B0RDL5_PUCGR|nr:hypothetical protein PGTUg99_010234 [Puccinia graminis f. sp. tritici]
MFFFPDVGEKAAVNYFSSLLDITLIVATFLFAQQHMCGHQPRLNDLLHAISRLFLPMYINRNEHVTPSSCHTVSRLALPPFFSSLLSLSISLSRSISSSVYPSPLHVCVVLSLV